jgi:ribosomal protein S20
MPIIESAKKALRQSNRRRERNLSKIKAFKEAIKAFKKAPSDNGLSSLFQKLDKAVKARVITKNRASRLKSQFSKKLSVKS